MFRLSVPLKALFIMFSASLMLIAYQAISSASGATTGVTGAPGESNCTSCHTGTPVSNSTAVNVITNMGNGQYIPDSTYQIKVRAKKTSCVKFGFSLTMLNANASPTRLGNLQVPTSATRVQLSTGTRDYMTHTTSGTSALYTDSTEWIVNWKAPASLSGDAKLYIALNATNNNGIETGDEIHLRTFTFPQTTNVPVASITTNVSSSCVGDSVLFSGSGTNGTTSYEWVFPGGSPATSTSQTQWVKFSSGTKVCSLRVANGIMYSAYTTKTISVNIIPIANLSYNSTTLLCSGDSLSMNANFGTGYTYQWVKDGSAISGANSIQYYAKTSGNYQVMVTNPSGCSNISSTASLSFNQSPVATLSSAFGVTSTCQGDSIRLAANAGLGYSYFWFRDNVLFAQSIDSFMYVYQGGNYQVRIFNTVGCNTLSNIIPLNFYVQPSGIIAAPFDSICVGDMLTLSAFTSDTVVDYQWYKDSVQIQGAVQRDYDVLSTGSYMVDLISNRGCKSTLPAKFIKVNPLPIVNYIDTARNGCIYTVQVRYQGNYTYQWFKDGGVFPGNTASITVTQSGDYSALITNSSGCSRTTNTLSITIPTPAPNFIDSVRVGCAYQLKLRNPGNFNWQWQQDGITFNGKDSIVNVDQSGTYTVLVTNNAGCSVYTNDLVLNIPATLPDTTLLPRVDATFCSDSSGVTYQVPFSPALSYRWFKNGIAIPGANTHDLLIKDSGDYFVTVSNGFCSFNSVTRHVSVNLSPVATFTSSKSEFCSGDSALLTANNQSGASYQWYWNNQQLIGEYTNTLKVKTSGSYRVKLILGPCSSSSTTQTITVNPLPTTPVITRNVNTLSCTPANSYQWFKNNVAISGANAQTYVVNSDGTYAVKITDLKGCSSTSPDMQVTYTGLQRPEKNWSVTLYPNPVHHQLTIQGMEQNSFKYSLMDASGRWIIQDAAGTQNEIDCSELPAGLYLIQIHVSGQILRLKFVKE